MSDRMELIMDGNIQKIGKATAVVRIPADTVKVLGLRLPDGDKPGSRVLVHKEGRRLILEFPEEGEKPEKGPEGEF